MATPRLNFLILILAACCATPALAQSPNERASTAADTSASLRLAAAPASIAGVRRGIPVVPERGEFFQRYGIGSYESPLGFGGRIATSLTSSMNLRVGASFFSFTTSRSISGIPFDANVRFQSEEAQVDWYPFHGSFYLSPGVMFGSSNRVYGSALIPAGNSFTLNGENYYSGAADPVHASGGVRFPHTAPMFTLGWGNWVRQESRGHWVFPFEMGAVFWGEPDTALNFSGTVCTDSGLTFCRDISNDPSVQANVKAERDKLQKDANWLKIYPVIAGGVVYRF
jgi:hypothetical protein